MASETYTETRGDRLRPIDWLALAFFLWPVAASAAVMAL